MAGLGGTSSWALPIHEVHVSSRCGERLECLLNESTEIDWVFWRNPLVRLPLSKLILKSRTGLPVLCPEVVLLYKGKSPRPVDEQDFQVVHPQLGPERCAWLVHALAVTDPEHPWLASLQRRT